MTTPAMLPRARAVARIPDVSFRTVRGEADYVELSELFKAANRHDEIPWLPTPANVRSEIAGRHSLDPGRDVLLAEVDGWLIGMTGVARVVRDGEPVYEMWGSVLPAYRRHGLGTALLEWALDRARQRAAAEDPDRAVSVAGDAEDQEIGHRALLARAGFEPVRHFLLMRRPTLDDVPDAPLPHGVEIRPVTPAQRRAVLEAEFEAFEDHWGNRERTEESFTVTLSRPELDTELSSVG